MKYKQSVARSLFRFPANLVFAFALLLILSLIPCLASAQQPTWIWSPRNAIAVPDQSQGECFYRKKFTLVRPVQAQLQFAAGDEFEIHINGKLASRGQSYGSSNELDVTSMMVPGVNLIAAKVRHNGSNQLGLSAKLRIMEAGETRWRSLSTDETWKTRVDFMADWHKTSYNDLGWLTARSVKKGNLSQTNEVSKQVAVSHDRKTSPAPAAGMTSAGPVAEPIATTTKPQSPLATQPNAARTGERFEIDPEFEVQQVLTAEETGSLIAMEFNEFGQMLLSREGGPLLIADPDKPVNHPARVRVYCEQVTSCQGILPLNGDVYVTGQGPEGLGLYLLSDDNRDGVLESVKKVLGFTGELGEHGPHGIQLGLDGMIYVIIGNGSQLEEEVADTSPYKNWYEGDLIPRYEDPGGHAEGVKAPGGTIIRFSVDGSKIERVAGGVRNAYDLVFDERGELFIHDSDMESDEGTTWYRPTMVFHVADGAEFGWRSGWSKFPQHYIDQSPAVCDTGRGSPTGAVLYQHLHFPVRYQNTLFLADWSEGRILALRKLRSGAGYVAEPEVFLAGRPLNVCDLAIAENGAMYFCTGGRGTAGGVYRVAWKGQVPGNILEFESDLAKIIRHPQPSSAWARQSIAELKKNLGDQWQSSVEGVATEIRNPVKFRLRAMQLMVLYGPVPSDEFLTQLASDSDPEIRAQVALLCGLKGGEKSTSLLANLLADNHPLVRRVTCESFMRLGVEPEVPSLLPLLSSLDRVETLAARRLLERIPAEKYEKEILNTDDKRIFIQGSLALMTASPTLERAYNVLAKSSNLMDGFLNDQDFVDLLRVMELTVEQGQVDPLRIPGLATRISNEFPSGSSIINQELARLLAFLKVGDLNGRLVEYLLSPDVPVQERVHLAMHLQTIGSGLSRNTRLAIIDCLESSRIAEGVGGSYALYLKRAVQDVSASMSPEETGIVLQNGNRWPNAALAAFYKIPDKLDQEMVQQVIDLDQSLKGDDDPAALQLRLGVIAVLARSHGAFSMEYLRQLWQNEVERRNDIVIGLAQQPDGENWAYLVSSLPILDDMTGEEVVKKLETIPRRPRDPQHFRHVIELGYRLRNQGAFNAMKLLEFWAGEKPNYPSSDWQAGLNVWSSWFQQRWPEQPAIASGVDRKEGRYSVHELVSYLEQNGLGDPQRGQHLFTTAQCSQCHQLGSAGQNAGPDLTSLSHRFSLREILEATIEPSKTIPDRYQSKKVLTVDGDLFSGMGVEQPDGGYVILQNDGKRVRIARDDIEEVRESQVSAMPEGLLNGLSQSEIADLMAFILQTENNQAAQTENEMETR